MQMPILSNDLKKYRNKKILKIVTPFVILLAISVALCFLLSREIPALKNATENRTIATYAVLLVFPFILTGFPKKLIDKSWCGEIVDVDTEFHNTLYKLNNSSTYTKASIILKVKLGKRTKEIEVFTSPEPSEISFYSRANWKPAGKIEYQVSKYSIGDKVYHFYLFDHLFIENKNEQNVTCIVCGAINPEGNEKCPICNHSILSL